MEDGQNGLKQKVNEIDQLTIKQQALENKIADMLLYLENSEQSKRQIEEKTVLKETLDYNSVALQHAKRYMEEYKIGIIDYLSIYKEAITKKTFPIQLSDNPVAVTYQVFYQKLPNVAPEALVLLQLIVSFDLENLTCKQLLNFLDGTNIDEERLNAYLSILEKNMLIFFQPNTKAVSIPQLAKEIIYYHLKKEEDVGKLDNLAKTTVAILNQKVHTVAPSYLDYSNRAPFNFDNLVLPEDFSLPQWLFKNNFKDLLLTIIDKTEPAKLGNLLIAATKKIDLKVIERLIKRGVDINFKDADGLTAMHHAATMSKAHYGVVNNALPYMPWTPKPSVENVKLVKRLLEAGANLGEQNPIGETPLHLAINNNSTITKIFLDYLYTIKQTNQILSPDQIIKLKPTNGKTLLHYAIESNHYGMFIDIFRLIKHFRLSLESELIIFILDLIRSHPTKPYYLQILDFLIKEQSGLASLDIIELTKVLRYFLTLPEIDKDFDSIIDYFLSTMISSPPPYFKVLNPADTIEIWKLLLQLNIKYRNSNGLSNKLLRWLHYENMSINCINTDLIDGESLLTIIKKYQPGFIYDIFMIHIRWLKEFVRHSRIDAQNVSSLLFDEQNKNLFQSLFELFYGSYEDNHGVYYPFINDTLLLLRSYADLPTIKFVLDNCTVGNQPLLHSVVTNKKQFGFQLLDLLIQTGISLTTRDKDGFLAIELARSEASLHLIISSMLSLSPDWWKQQENSKLLFKIWQAFNSAQNSWLSNLRNYNFKFFHAIMSMLDAGANPNVQDKDGNSILHLIVNRLPDASFEERKLLIKMVVFIISKDGNPDIRNHKNEEPASTSLKDQWPEYVQAVEEGLSLRAKEPKKDSSLSQAQLTAQAREDWMQTGTTSQQENKTNDNAPNNKGFGA